MPPFFATGRTIKKAPRVSGTPFQSDRVQIVFADSPKRLIANPNALPTRAEVCPYALTRDVAAPTIVRAGGIVSRARGIGIIAAAIGSRRTYDRAGGETADDTSGNRAAIVAGIGRRRGSNRGNCKDSGGGDSGKSLRHDVTSSSSELFCPRTLDCYRLAVLADKLTRSLAKGCMQLGERLHQEG
jgi:hypothetical protein